MKIPSKYCRFALEIEKAGLVMGKQLIKNQGSQWENPLLMHYNAYSAIERSEELGEERDGYLNIMGLNNNREALAKNKR